MWNNYLAEWHTHSHTHTTTTVCFRGSAHRGITSCTMKGQTWSEQGGPVVHQNRSPTVRGSSTTVSVEQSVPSSKLYVQGLFYLQYMFVSRTINNGSVLPLQVMLVGPCMIGNCWLFCLSSSDSCLVLTDSCLQGPLWFPNVLQTTTPGDTVYHSRSPVWRFLIFDPGQLSLKGRVCAETSTDLVFFCKFSSSPLQDLQCKVDTD